MSVPVPQGHPNIVARRALVALAAFQGLSGLAGGIPLLVDPTGELLRLPIELIADAPVIDDYLLPGLALAGPLGAFAVATAWAVHRRRDWAAVATVALGVMLTGFMAVEVAVIGPPVHWSQALYGAVGISMLGLAPLAARRP